MRRVLDDREVEQGRRRRKGEIENQNLVFCIIGFYVLSGFFFLNQIFFFLIMLTWKIVKASKVSVIYIYRLK